MNNRIVYLLIFSFALFSCGDFLEPKSKSEFVPKDASSLNELLLGEAYPRYDTRPLNTFLNVLDDDVACAPYQELTTGQNRNSFWAPYTWQPRLYEYFKESSINASYYNIYKTFYTLILGSNAILDYIGDVNDEADVVNLVTAQALTLRGFYYFTLVNLYAPPYYYNKEALGVPLKLNSGIEDGDLKRSKVSEVYTQILKDLQEAERLYKLLPAEDQWKQDYRTSLPMVQLLLSRVYLYMEDWSNAANYADKVINDYNFQLLDLNEVSDTTSKGVPTYRNYYNYNSPEIIWLYGNIEDATYLVNKVGAEEHVLFKASDALMNSYEKTEGDLRKTRYIIREKEARNINGQSVYIPQAFSKINVSDKYIPKGTTNFARSFRLSEAYLNLSEATAMLYKTQSDNNALTRSLKALNTLRQNRFDRETYQQENITNADQLITFIQEERRRELCFEDHRWFDLRRWGMKEIKRIWYPDANSQVEYTLQENDPSFTLPFPQEAMDLNKRLEQNPLAPAPRSN